MNSAFTSIIEKKIIYLQFYTLDCQKINRFTATPDSICFKLFQHHSSDLFITRGQITLPIITQTLDLHLQIFIFLQTAQ